MSFNLPRILLLLIVFSNALMAQSGSRVHFTKAIQASSKDYVAGEMGFIVNADHEDDSLQDMDRSGFAFTTRLGASGVGACIGYGLGMWSQHQGLMGIYPHAIIDYDWRDFGYSKVGWSIGPGIRVALSSLILNLSYSRMIKSDGGYLALSIGLGD